MKNLSVKPVRWAINPGTPREDALRLEYHGHFLVVRWADARKLVDAVHDAADNHDRALREGNK